MGRKGEPSVPPIPPCGGSPGVRRAPASLSDSACLEKHPRMSISPHLRCSAENWGELSGILFSKDNLSQ